MEQKFKVTRPHFGDQPYKKGDVRVADPRKVKNLVGRGVLVAITEDTEALGLGEAQTSDGDTATGDALKRPRKPRKAPIENKTG